MMPRSISSIAIGKLVIQDTGGYNPIFARPYQSHLNGVDMNNVMNRVSEAGMGNVSGSMLAGALGSMIEPASAPGALVSISNGWQERRGRFVMEVHVAFNTGSAIIYYFQGYTDHLGISNQGHMDPNMTFTINSFMAVNRLTQLTPSGVQARDMVVETGHLLTNENWQGPYGGSSQYLLRPQDIFRGINTGYLADSNDVSMSTHTDTSNLLKRDPSKSSRSNNLPCNYVAKIIEGYQIGASSAEYGQSTQDIYERSRQQVYEAHPSENPFIRAISDIRAGGISNRFFFADLDRIDPNARNVINYSKLSPAQTAGLHTPGATSYWNASDRSTVVATILSHAVPALMMDLMISKTRIYSHNHDITGAMDTKLIGPMGLSNADMSRNFEVFKQRLEREVLLNITFGNQERYMLDMQVDLFGETQIQISLNSDPMVPFVTPSFADGLFTPVIAQNRGEFTNLVHDFETMLGNVADVGIHKNAAISNLI